MALCAHPSSSSSATFGSYRPCSVAGYPAMEDYLDDSLPAQDTYHVRGYHGMQHHQHPPPMHQQHDTRESLSHFKQDQYALTPAELMSPELSHLIPTSQMDLAASMWPVSDYEAKAGLTMINSTFDESLAGGMVLPENAFGVDPSLIHQIPTPASGAYAASVHLQSTLPSLSPATSVRSAHSNGYSTHHHSAVASPEYTFQDQRVPHAVSTRSTASTPSETKPGITFSTTDEDGRERMQCPWPECGKSFKDLKAHMLTHQHERPQKCPIQSCEFHKRGFARRYDRNRHLVTTHYKATITCGFCPTEGNNAKTFNRADVFKRHLITAHGVDQNSSVSKKRASRGSGKQSPVSTGASGKCSTCCEFYVTPQELFDHLDECILRVVTQKDPGESVNERHLRAIESDDEVLATMQRHALHSHSPSVAPSVSGDEHLSDDERQRKTRKTNDGNALAVNDTKKGQAGLTFSKGGRDLHVAKGRRRRKDYPQSWGCSMDDMTMKKRVLCVFDGQRRLWKDDMMLGNNFNISLQLPDGTTVSDLDVETMRRAEGFHNATDEERGPWLPTNYYSGTFPWAETPL